MITRIGIQILGWLLLALLTLGDANAQQVNLYWQAGTGLTQWQPVSATNPLPVSASVSASISGFTAVTTGTPIAVTTGGVTGTLPAGTVVVATNVGTTNAAYCALGASATTSSQYIAPAGGWFAFTVGASTQLTCITSTSTTTVNMTGGAGLPTGTGGGGGGSGGAITIASGAVASGAYSSGAFASGSIAAGAQVDLLTMRGTKNAGTAAANSLLTGGVYNSTPLTLTDTQQASLQFDANGYLKVNTAAGAAAGGTSSNFGSAFPTPGTAVGFSDGTNMVAAKVGAVANVAAATNMLNVLPACNYNATPLTVTDTRYQSVQCDINGFMKVNVTNANANGQATMANSSPVVVASNQTAIPVSGTPYPATAVPYTATATGTTGATTATLAGAASVTTYICGFSIRANATAAATGNATVTGVITATLNFTQWTAPNASGLGITEMIFAPCIPASGTNQSVAVVSAAPGTGGVVSVTAWGYKL